MMKITPDNSFPSFPPPSQLGGRNVEYQQTTSQTRDFNISIQTREGDKVTISGADLQSLAVSGGPGRMSAEAVVAGFRSSSVEGDLNDEELADIRKLLNDLRSIASHFFDGRFDQAIAKAGRLGELGGSLASLDASFSRTVSFSQVVTIQPMPASFQEAVGHLAEAARPAPGLEAPPDFQGLLNDRWQQVKAELSSLPAQTKLMPSGYKKLLAAIEPPTFGAGRPPYQSAAQAARDLFERAITELIERPEIAPLLPEIGSEAIRQAASFFQPEAQSAANRLQHEFKNLFRSWVLPS